MSDDEQRDSRSGYWRDLFFNFLGDIAFQIILVILFFGGLYLWGTGWFG